MMSKISVRERLKIFALGLNAQSCSVIHDLVFGASSRNVLLEYL